MTARVLRPTPRYMRSVARLGVAPGSPRGRAVGGVIAALMTEPSLPGREDIVALVPPTRTALVRRIPDQNLWLWYVEVGHEVWLLVLTSAPPVPVG